MLRGIFVASVSCILALAAGVSASGGGGETGTNQATEKVVSSGTTYVISGRGWGHGVGMSQYGARGFAERRFGYAKILTHYYAGTTLERTAVRKVRVLLVEGRAKVTVASESAFRVRDGKGDVHQLRAGRYTLGPALKLTPVGAKAPKALPAPLLFIRGDAPLELDRLYRGSLEVARVADGKLLRVVNVVGLEAYLYGVVPAEMPHDWPGEALKAQAVVARSYALANRRGGSAFDLYNDVRSQVYLGIEHEKPAANAAVDATTARVLTYRGDVVSTPYHSTSGGRTAASHEIWTPDRLVPYLVSVSDPYDSISPYHRWQPYTVEATTLARKLRPPGRFVDVTTTKHPSGRVATVNVQGSTGERELPAGDVRRALDLRSTWFRIGAMSLSAPVGPVVFGTKASLTGVARDLPRVVLERRKADGEWQPLTGLRRAADGTWERAISPPEPMEYRLASGDVATAPVRVGVAPAVRLLLNGTRIDSLRGTVRPLVAGATVQVQRLVGSTWKTVAWERVDAKGNFVAQLRVLQADYRARVVAGRGFAPGISPVLRVGP